MPPSTDAILDLWTRLPGAPASASATPAPTSDDELRQWLQAASREPFTNRSVERLLTDIGLSGVPSASIDECQSELSRANSEAAALRAQGRSDEAMARLSAARQTLREKLPTGHPLVLEAAAQEAFAAQAMGRWDVTTGTLVPLIAVHERAYGLYTTARALALTVVAAEQEARGAFAEVRASREGARSAALLGLGEHTLQYFLTTLNLAKFHLRVNDLEAGRDLLETSLDLATRFHGGAPGRYAETVSMYAFTLAQLGRAEEAAGVLDPVLRNPAFPQSFAPAHRCAVLDAAATTMFMLGRPRDALRLGSAAVFAGRQASDPLQLATAANNLGLMLVYQGEPVGGELLLREAELIRVGLPDGSLDDLRTCRMNVAFAVLRRQVDAGAIDVMLQAEEQHARRFGQLAAGHAVYLNSSAFALIHAKRFQEADDRLDRAERLLAGPEYAKSATLGVIFGNRSMTRFMLGDAAGARQYLAKARTVMDESPLARQLLQDAHSRMERAIGTGRVDQAEPLAPVYVIALYPAQRKAA